MNGEVLQTSKFPEVTFESSEVRAERQKDDLYRLKCKAGWTFMAWQTITPLWPR